MQIETLKDVLHWTKEFHQQLAHNLAENGKSNDSDRAKMLLDYLDQHETKLAQTIAKFEETGDQNALNTWCYEFLDKHPITQHQQPDILLENLSSSEITTAIAKQHQQIIELYRYLHNRAETASAKELLENLLALEKHEVMQMVQNANRLEGI